MTAADDNHGGGALVPSTERPQFSAEDLALIDSSGADTDADVLHSARRSVELGLLTVEAAARRWNLSAAEAAELTKPVKSARRPSALQAIDAEIAKLSELRKADRKAYWGDQVQSRLSKLYAQRELVAAGVPAEQAGSGAIPPNLRAQWGKLPDGVAGALKAIRLRTAVGFEGMEEQEIEALKASFDNDLDDASQEAIAAGLANDTHHPPATAAEVREFVQETEYGRDLMRLWGEKAAPAMLGRAKREANLLWASMTETSKLRTERWIGQRPTEHKVAIIRALAARGARRL